MRNMYCFSSFATNNGFENIAEGDIFNGIDKNDNDINWSCCLIPKNSIDTIDILHYFINAVKKLENVMETNGYKPTHIYTSNGLYDVLRIAIRSSGTVSISDPYRFIDSGFFVIFGFKVVPFNLTDEDKYVVNMTDFDWNEAKPFEIYNKIDSIDKFPVKVIV